MGGDDIYKEQLLMDILNQNEELAHQASKYIDEAIKQSENYNCRLGKYTNENDTQLSQWMTIEDFSITNGLKKIEEYVKTWERSNHWLHTTGFLSSEICQDSKRYRYIVQWSMPSRKKTMPKATASVFFTIELSTIRPKNVPVKVYFVVEGHSLVHRPGRSKFREQWLTDIIDSKTNLVNIFNASKPVVLLPTEGKQTTANNYLTVE